MSYDLTLFQVPDGLDARTQYEQVIEQRSELEASSPALSESALALRRSTADALKRWRPSLEEFQLATPQSSIELNDEELQIQFSVYGDVVEVTVPYFRDQRKQSIARIAESLEILRIAAGYHAYDPQLGRIVTATDGAAMLEKYSEVDPSVLLQAFPKDDEQDSSTKKAWWKFW